jgi:trans-aconitate 2-methyltransferase
MAVAWDPSQYLKFAGQRLRPALDLLARIPLDNPTTVVDLGCGAGNVTRRLAERWPQARITGVDASTEMLTEARAALPNVEWIEANLAEWRPQARVDVIYSNAALHWLPDHNTQFLRLLDDLAPGGVLAVQMPRNFGAPSHTSVAAAARAGPWRATLEQLLKPPPAHEPAFYYDLLVAHCSFLDIWETEYLQVLEGDHAVAEWTRGTWLKPFLDALDGAPDREWRAGFEREYVRLVDAAYPRRADGKTLFPFRRVFMVATKR